MSFFLLVLPVVVTGLLSSWAFTPTCASLAGGVALFFASSSPLHHWFVYLLRPWVIPPPKPMELSVLLVDMANIARKYGILALEKLKIEFPPLHAAKNHCVDGFDPDTLKSVMDRERRVVVGQIMELVDTLKGIAVALCLMFVFLMANTWWLEKGGNVRVLGGGLFLVLLVYAPLRGRLERLAREMDEIYKMIIDGIVGIQTGVNPRILMTTLQSGIRFDWRMKNDSRSFPWEVTREQVEKQLTSYLEEIHPQLRRINVNYEITPGNPVRKTGRFSFNDLILTDNLSFQVLLREISNDDLVHALKGATSEMIRKMIDNMSPKSAAYILDQLELIEFPDDEVVEKAQSAILKIARQLEAQGSIVVMGRSTDDITE